MLECSPLLTVQLILMVSVRAHGTVPVPKYCRTVNNSAILTLSISNFKQSNFWEPTRVTKLGLWQISGGEGGQYGKQPLATDIVDRWSQSKTWSRKRGNSQRRENLGSARFPGGGRCRDQTSAKNKTLLWCLEGELGFYHGIVVGWWP